MQSWDFFAPAADGEECRELGWAWGGGWGGGDGEGEGDECDGAVGGEVWG